MAGMYPDNQELDIFGEKVQWPGVDSSGKFSNGSFKNPLEKPSFIPAETINLILDNLSELIKKFGGTPNNMSIDQIARLFTYAPSANKAIMRDAAGRAKTAAPQAGDDIARKKEVDDAKSYAHAQDNEKLAAAKGYTDSEIKKEAQSRTQGDANAVSSAKNYTNDLLIKIFKNGYIQWPGMPTPGSIFSFPGYRWSKVNYNGCFFRAEGAGALPFNGGEQGDAIRNIKGSYAVYSSEEETSDLLKTKYTKGVMYTGSNPYPQRVFEFDASRVVPTATENRSRNRTFIIWRLEKV